MSGGDACRFINDQDEATIRMFVSRLEFRGQAPTFARMREDYLDRLPLASASRALDLGCGTGIVARAIAKRAAFGGLVVGVDQSPIFIEAARGLAADDGVTERIEFAVGDVHTLDYPDASFDVVVAHTTISHVADPLTMLKEAARLVRPGGQVAIFDGDYASWTFAHPEPALAKAMDEGLQAVVVNNPRVLRDLPRLLREAGLERLDTLAYVYNDIGAGSFFRGPVEGYAPLVARAGLLSAEQVERWQADQRRAMEEGIFFSACNYYTYLARRARSQ